MDETWWRAGYDLAAWVIGIIGPGDPEARWRWLRIHLDRLDDAAFEAGPNENGPALRVWMALYAEYGRLGYDGQSPA